jgi:hypothetical protein
LKIGSFRKKNYNFVPNWPRYLLGYQTLSVKYPKLKVLGPSFVETGDEMRYQEENSIARENKKEKKKGRGGPN